MDVSILEGLSPADRIKNLIGFLPAAEGKAPEKDLVRIHLTAEDLKATVLFREGKVDVEAGHQGEPTSHIVGQSDALWELFTGGANDIGFLVSVTY